MLPVIIANFNRYNLLKQTIESLFKNSVRDIYPIVVDDNSDDEITNNYLKELSDGKKIKLCKMRIRSGPGVCKTYGASIAPNSEYLYFSDNDVYFEEGWNEKLLSALAFNQEIGILGGSRHPHHGVYISENGLDFSDQQVGYTMLMRKSVWNDIGPYDRGELGEYGVEDTEICNRCRALGLKIASLKQEVIVHCGLTHIEGTNTAGVEEMIKIKNSRPELLFE